MAKFFGPIGFADPVETRPGVWIDRIVERNYYGDVEKNTGGWSTSSDSVNDDLTVNGQISIVADPYALNHFHSIKYIEWMGAKWKVKNANPKYPRLVLTVGGVYNGEQT